MRAVFTIFQAPSGINYTKFVAFPLAGMPDRSIPELNDVRKLNSLTFSEGLSFVALPFREEWTQSETRLNRMAEGGYEPLIERIGGPPFPQQLQ